MDGSECVLSDIHLKKIVSDSSRKLQVTRFIFRVPASDNDSLLKTQSFTNADVTFDEDGDYEFDRTPVESSYDVIRLLHRMSTDLHHVGMQVWRGALVLCDYILHNKDRFLKRHILELGCGTGLSGIVTSQYAASVICTDYCQEVLDLCQQNLDENSRFNNSNCLCSVKKLDWFQELNPQDLKLCPEFIFVADCIYENGLTDALFRTLYRFLTAFESKPVILIALEKRFNFTLNELDVTCHEYDHFRRCLKDLEKLDGCSVRNICLEMLPVYFDYDRTNYVELWEIHN